MTEAQEGNRHLAREPHEREGGHPLLIWTSLAPGDVVSLRGPGNQVYIGTVESRTIDGLIIWMRDDLNDRKAFHFREFQSVRVIKASPS